MVTGFIKLNGMTVGAVANRTEVYGDDGEKKEEFEAVLTAKGARKAAKFVEFCDAFEIPVLTITNTTGFKADLHSERCIAKATAQLTYAFANATGDTPQSEWNVYVDPEAAAIVYNSGVNLVAIGLDVATHFDVNLTENDIAALDKSDKMEAGFLRQAIRFVNGRGFEAYCTVIDCMAVAYSIDESLIETFEGRVGIETKDGLTLGNTVVDYRHHHVWEDLPKVKIARNADHQRFLNMLMELVLA